MKLYIDPARVTLPAPAPGDLFSLMALARDPSFAALIIEPNADLWITYKQGFSDAVHARCTPIPDFYIRRDSVKIPGLGRLLFSVDNCGTVGRELDHVFRGIEP